MLRIYDPIGGLVLVWIKLGIRLQSWGRSPGNIRIDISSRTGVLGMCGGENTLHGAPTAGSDVGSEKRKEKGGGRQLWGGGV